MKIGYSSKSGHVATKNKQTNSSCKNNDSSTNNCVKAFNDRKDIMTGKKETLTWTRNWSGVYAKNIFYLML